jgi:hypothetical protein
MERIENFSMNDWQGTFDHETQMRAIAALESGKILYFPQLPFEISNLEQKFLSPSCVDTKTKNISYDSRRDHIKGAVCDEGDRAAIKNMMRRYKNFTQGLINKLLPHYNVSLASARTSFRPVEILGRPTSYRKDDTRLHVDAFPSSPNQGRRILRIFCNINPQGKDRVWRMGEPFAAVAQRFVPKLPKQIPGTARFMQLLKITKGYRTPYDHLMLHMHDNMKADLGYQANAVQAELRFPPGSTWIVYTDCVSHAAMTGQHLLEQTFHLPVSAMQQPALAPISILEKICSRKLD